MAFSFWPKKVVEVVKDLTDQHPYYPKNVVLPGYNTQKLDFQKILGVFAVAAVVVILLSFFLSGLRKKKLSLLDRVVISWWTCTGLIHFIVEGWVVSQADFYKDRRGNYLSEVWKEYAKADSRYATRDTFVISMEGFTAFVEGPFCFLCVYALFTRKSWRHVLQILVACCQIYGDVLYYITTWYEGFVHSRPEALYFWGYFVAVNFIWILIPSLIVFRCARQVNRAVNLEERSNRASKSD